MHTFVQAAAMKSFWQVWVDTGGTFTDCVAVDPQSRIHRAKVLSSSALRGKVRNVIDTRSIAVTEKWEVPRDFIRGFRFKVLGIEHETLTVTRYLPGESIVLDGPVPENIPGLAAFEVHSQEDAPVLASRIVTGRPFGTPLPAMKLRLATTRGTNALLERAGEPTALFITEGFKDLLRIGNQQRPDLFALRIEKSDPVYERVVEVPERICADGTVLRELETGSWTDEISRVLDSGIRTAAVALLHSYVDPAHERRLARILKAMGFQHVTISSEAAPFIKIVPRAETTVINAYLSPIIDTYLERVQTAIPEGGIHIMTSAGGLVKAESYKAKDSLLSGPAGGVVGAALSGHRLGYERIIAFDMGGTSTDVSRFDGDYDYVFEHEVGNAHLVAPALAIESVAAGGGSICSYDGVEMRVGPESAGAEPGPACYGAGGPLCLTDVNLLLGRLDPSRFEIPINPVESESRIEIILDAIANIQGKRPEREEILEGFHDIANARMADAIRKISIRKGYNPKEYALVAFGGAGGQHAVAIAERLGIRTIVIPKDASLLSAFGLGHAVIERFAEQQVLRALDKVEAEIPGWLSTLSESASNAVLSEGIQEKAVEIRRRIVNLRLSGQDATLQVEYDADVPLSQAFEEAYRSIYGHWPEGRSIEVESIRVVASTKRLKLPVSPGYKNGFDTKTAGRVRKQKAYFRGRWCTVSCYDRDHLHSGSTIEGPALIVERHSTTVVQAGWRCRIDVTGSLVLEMLDHRILKENDTRPEIVRLELFTNRLLNIAAEMGERLRRTALSTNVKERLDFSCAILDKDGDLVVNAPHIPVHLGSMGLCVQSLRAVVRMEPGDVVVTNHPKYGGSHLPDVTVVTPVYVDRILLGYVANRAHHAEIGGIRPGSMPATATCMADEGVIINPMHLIHQGQPRWDEMKRILTSAPYPSRAVEENLADLSASVAANHSGAEALSALAAEHGTDTVWEVMEALKGRAEKKIRAALSRIPDGIYEAVETLDDRSPIHVKIRIEEDRAILDFSGTAGVHPMNMNATPAIVHSAVIYILRLLLDESLPLNAGLMRPVTLNIPEGMLNPPFPEDPFQAPSIVGGNVETSQRLVDTMIKALRLCACSQGTMNNTLFGTDRYSYYETVCGGCGAGPGFEGASAVHSHMTNTRITDPEIIERRYPVRVENFGIREGSGGRGKYRGGDGAVREITFLEDMSLSVLGQHRKEGPFGMSGGKPGKPAEQMVIRASGEMERLSSIDGCDVSKGDTLILKTPGGGGFDEE